MTDNEIKREKTFSEELPYFKERIKEVFDNFDNPDGYADMLYLSALSDSHRLVRKAEEEINRQQAEIERLKKQIAEVNKTIKSEAVREFAERFEKEIKDVKFTLGQFYETNNAFKDIIKETDGEKRETESD